QGPARNTIGRYVRPAGADRPRHRAVGDRAWLGLPLAGPAVPLRTPCLLDGCAPSGRERRGHGEVRSTDVPGTDRASPRHTRTVRADHVRAHAQAPEVGT